MEWIGLYQIIGDRIGIGSFGTVYMAWDSTKDEIVALKMIKKTALPRAETREIPLLLQMQHDNIIRLWDVEEDETYWYLVFEFMEMDLNKYMLTHPEFAYDRRKRKKFLHQILSAVAYCHSRNILHRDLKPRNVLVDCKTDTLKLTDFGLARTFSNTDTALTPKVGTRPYRSPEILLGSSNYSTPTDVWSVGCIFAEMVNLKQLFPEKGPAQLHMIYSLLGTPNENTWPGVTSLPDFTPNLILKDLAAAVPSLEREGFDLLSKMLCMNPNNRITAQAALEHEYFKKD